MFHVKHPLFKIVNYYGSIVMPSIVEVPEEQAKVGVIWICLNSVDFTGNDEAVKEHRRLLLAYRKKIAKINDIEISQVESEMLDYYE
tara:strand:- start:13 stop:273 length:261 start_codon:yes stop_codon:yes gene_type:complete